MRLQVLSKILACGLGAGAVSCFALKQSADSGDLASPTAQRLQLGLMGFSAGELGGRAGGRAGGQLQLGRTSGQAPQPRPVRRGWRRLRGAGSAAAQERLRRNTAAKWPPCSLAIPTEYPESNALCSTTPVAALLQPTHPPCLQFNPRCRAGAIGLHLLYSPSITVSSLAMGAAVMGATFAVPYGHYRLVGGWVGMEDACRCAENA